MFVWFKVNGIADTNDLITKKAVDAKVKILRILLPILLCALLSLNR